MALIKGPSALCFSCTLAAARCSNTRTESSINVDFNIYLHTIDIFLKVLEIFIHDFWRGSSPKELSLHLTARYAGNSAVAASLFVSQTLHLGEKVE